MIQRIQSLFLLVAIVCCSLVFFFPVASVETTNGLLVWGVTGAQLSNADAVVEAPSHYPLLAISGLQLLVTIVVLLRFSNRKQQLRLGRINGLLLFLFLGSGITYSFFLKPLAAQPNEMPQFGLALVFGLVALILNIMALRAIHKDEELVRSVDRLR
ncbi:MAG: DUF4293 domain-containing protein [Salibacteraceae bacterium]